jgi:hypothetical protein
MLSHLPRHWPLDVWSEHRFTRSRGRQQYGIETRRLYNGGNDDGYKQNLEMLLHSLCLSAYELWKYVTTENTQK